VTALVHIVTGKGGTGKTTLSCALGLAYAELGYKTLVISIDFAQNIDDVLGIKLQDKPREVTRNLFAMRIDIDKEIDVYMNEVSKRLSSTFPQWSAYNLDKYLTILKYMPGVEEHVIVSKLMNILEQCENFDIVVVDTPPTGVAARLLALPEAMRRWLERLVELRQEIVKLRQALHKLEHEDPILNTLRQDLEKYSKLSNLLKTSCKISIVTTLEKLPVLEALRILKVLKELGLRVHSIVLNKYSESSGRKVVLDMILREVPSDDVKIVKIPELEEEPQGIDKLSLLKPYVENLVRT